MILFYNLFLFLYTSAIRVLSLFNPKARQWVAGRRHLLSRIHDAMRDEPAPRIWMHCASLGEFEQGRPVLEALCRQYPDHKIVLTFFSPSGYEIRQDYEGADYVFYLPMDGPVHARRFLDAVQPRLVLFVKYEFWHYYLREVRQRQIPALLIAAVFRKNQVFFKWYGGFFRNILRCFTHLLVQDRASLDLLAGIGLQGSVAGADGTPRVLVGGDTRYDRVGQIAAAARDLPEIEAFLGGSQALIGGSTWPCDENILKHLSLALPRDWKVIIAPHEIDDKHIRNLLRLFKDEAVLYSVWKETLQSDKRVLLIDNIGMLSSLYRYGDVAHVGGGFKRAGIHNILEPAVFGLPVLIGPVYEKFAEAVSMVAAGYVFPVTDEVKALERLQVLLKKDWRASIREGLLHYMKEQQGATARVIALIEQEGYLEGERRAAGGER